MSAVDRSRSALAIQRGFHVEDRSALVAINDLRPVGEIWILSSLSCSRGLIYRRGLKHVVCIENSNP